MKERRKGGREGKGILRNRRDGIFLSILLQSIPFIPITKYPFSALFLLLLLFPSLSVPSLPSFLPFRCPPRPFFPLPALQGRKEGREGQGRKEGNEEKEQEGRGGTDGRKRKRRDKKEGRKKERKERNKRRKERKERQVMQDRQGGKDRE